GSADLRRRVPLRRADRGGARLGGAPRRVGGGERMSVSSTAPVLRAHGVGKSFFGVEVLRGIDFEVRPGEVHGLVGENGAGKSTLMKIIAGVQPADEGRIEYRGEEVRYSHPRQAMDAGIVTVFQEFTLLPERTVADNVFLGREPRRGGFVDRKAMNRRTQELL